MNRKKSVLVDKTRNFFILDLNRYFDYLNTKTIPVSFSFRQMKSREFFILPGRILYFFPSILSSRARKYRFSEAVSFLFLLPVVLLFGTSLISESTKL